jgi:mRNA interferase RelE/StbE
MVYYKVNLKSSVWKDFRAIDKDIIPKLWGAIEKLAENQRPFNSVKMKGLLKTYRLRIGDYRIIYQIEDGSKEVVIIAIGHRREIYR